MFLHPEDCGDIVAREGFQALARALAPRQDRVERLGGGEDAAQADFRKQFRFGAEVRVDEGLRHPQAVGDLVEGRVLVAFGVKKIDGGVERALALQGGDLFAYLHGGGVTLGHDGDFRFEFPRE